MYRKTYLIMNFRLKNNTIIHLLENCYQLQIVLTMTPIALMAFLLAILGIKANVWDNIFSQTLASSPIILSESLNFKFPLNYQGIQLEGTIDFNSQLKILTATAQKSVFLGLEIQVFRLQAEFQTYLLTIESVLNGCQKFRLVLSQEDKGKFKQIPIQSKSFLVNLLFEYIGRGKFDKTLSQYVLMPDLITQHEEVHEEYQINALVVVNKNGEIVKIYEDKDKKKQIPFSLKSKVSRKKECQGKVEELTKEDLYNKFRKSIQNKDYQKIPGFDKNSQKMPIINNLDFSKLPKNVNS